ncbi:MAG TPA: FtsX-like permease family protein [Patescibacteria group bacterium]|nr:FtsX-like permease family protein [Patescibacteria group bacterium]
MNVFSRGVRNAFRNSIRTVAIVGMLALSIGLALAMLLANQAVGQKINTVKKQIGTTITVAPAGIRGFQGGGDALTSDQMKTVAAVAHVTKVDPTLTDRLNSSSTNLQSSIDLGSFGKRQIRIDRGTSTSNGDTVVVPPNGGGDAPDMANFKPPLTVIGADNSATAVEASAGSTLTITSGKTFDGTKDALVALVGKSLATKNNLTTGSTFSAYGQTFTVSGIFDAGNTFGNDQIIMPLPTVQRLSNQANAVTGANVQVDSADNLDSATTAIKAALGDKADVTNEADQAKATLASLKNIQNVSLFSLIGAAGTAAVITLLTMVMIVRERRREIGVLKAIGGSNIRVMLQFTVEAITLTVLGALIGVIIGALAATPVTKMLANNADSNATSSENITPGGGPQVVQFNGKSGPGGFRSRFQNNSVTEGVKNLKANVNPGILAYGLGGAVLIAIIGSTAAAGLIAKVRPAEVMRAE